MRKKIKKNNKSRQKSQRKTNRKSKQRGQKFRGRILKDGTDYHVISIINNKEPLLSEPIIKNLYQKVLSECLKKYSFLIIQFIIMDNHIHLIIRPLKESLSKIMQWINSVFAMRFNKLTGRCGHVWKCRFWSSIIEKIEQFKKVYHYISYNSVKAGIVSSPEDYPYCGEYHISRGILGIITPYWTISYPYLWEKDVSFFESLDT